MDIAAKLSIAQALAIESDRLKYKSEHQRYLRSINYFHYFGRDRVCIKCGLPYNIYLDRLSSDINDVPSCCLIEEERLGV